MAVANTVYASTAICASIDLIAFAVNSAKDSFDCYLQSFLSLFRDRGYSWKDYIYSPSVRYTALYLNEIKEFGSVSAFQPSPILPSAITISLL